MAFHVIGDIHGHADELKTMLGKLGYRLQAGTWDIPVAPRSSSEISSIAAASNLKR